MKYTTIPFLILLFSSNIFGQTSLTKELNKAYERNSNSDLDLIFHEWNSNFKSNYKEINDNDTIKNIYEIFNEFYSPISLSRVGKGQWGDSLYLKSKYFIVQDKINYGFTNAYIGLDSIFSDSHYQEIDSTDAMMAMAYYGEKFWKFEDIFSSTIKNTISEFRPETNYDSKRVLYLTKYHKKGLNKFLGKTYKKIGKKVLRKKEPFKKSEFLSNYVTVIRQHWGQDWHIETHPYVNSIVIDKSFKYALIDFRLGFQGGFAYLMKRQDKWELISSGLIWIE